MAADPTQERTSGPLASVRVLVTGHGCAAIVAGALLADLGADVVVAEPAEGHPARRILVDEERRPLWWWTGARGMRSVASAETAVIDLAAAADVVIDDAASPFERRWGSRLDAARTVNPNLVTVRLSPHGETGPLASVAGSETTAEGLGGLVHITGAAHREPLHSDYPVGLAVTALFAALSSTAALYQVAHRPHAGGPHVDLASYEAVVRVLEFLPSFRDQLGWISERTDSTSDYQVPVNRWCTADGVWMSFTGNTEDIVHRFFAAIGHEELCTDERYATNVARVEHRGELEMLIDQWFASKTRAEVEQVMEAARVPIAAILSMREIFEEEQYLARGALADVVAPDGTELRMPNMAGRFSRSQHHVTSAGPDLGAHGEEVLQGWLAGPSPTGALLRSKREEPHPDADVGLPLTGLRVIDNGNVIAGPFCAALLGDLGADVVKVERPETGDLFRRQAPLKEGVSVWWSVGARNKRSIALDLKDGRDRATFLRLAGAADIVVENFVPGVADSLGIGHGALVDANPRIVLASISGYGQAGPLAGRRAFGRNAEAYSGMAFMTGYRGDRPQHTGFPVADSFSALLAATGALAAVHERDVAGSDTGQWFEVALFESVFRFMGPQALAFHLTGDVWERGRAILHPDVWRRTLPTADDAWVSLSVSPAITIDDIAAWMGLPAEQLLSADADLGLWSRRSTAAELQASAASAGIPCALVATVDDLLESPHASERGVFVSAPAPGLGSVLMPAPLPPFSGRRPEVRSAAPELDADREAILHSWLGATESEGARHGR